MWSFRHPIIIITSLPNESSHRVIDLCFIIKGTLDKLIQIWGSPIRLKIHHSCCFHSSTIRCDSSCWNLTKQDSFYCHIWWFLRKRKEIIIKQRSGLVRRRLKLFITEFRLLAREFIIWFLLVLLFNVVHTLNQFLSLSRLFFRTSRLGGRAFIILSDLSPYWYLFTNLIFFFNLLRCSIFVIQVLLNCKLLLLFNWRTLPLSKTFKGLIVHWLIELELALDHII